MSAERVGQLVLCKNTCVITVTIITTWRLFCRSLGTGPPWIDPGWGDWQWSVWACTGRSMDEEESGGENDQRRVHVGRRTAGGGQSDDVNPVHNLIPVMLIDYWDLHTSDFDRKLSHHKLVQLYGVCSQCSPLCLVFEFMENGCLSDYLRSRKGRLSQDLLLNMCVDVSEGMAYLESSNFIHRDLVIWQMVAFPPPYCFSVPAQLSSSVSVGCQELSYFK